MNSSPVLIVDDFFIVGFDTKMKEPSLLFSTCSQDSYVRIWRLNPVANETIRDESSENATAGEIRLKRQMFSIEKSPGKERIRDFIYWALLFLFQEK